MTHTVWFAGFIGVVGGVLGAVAGASGGVLAMIGLGLVGVVTGALGVASHIAADALTPMGVQPFAPRDETSYTYDLVRASNPLANYGLLILGVGFCLGAFLLGTRLHAIA